MFHHQAACSRKKRLRETVEADLAEQEANAIRIKTHDDVGRKLWLTAHNDICETCGGTGNLLLCSYCNTAWHFGCTGEGLTEAPEGWWMCSLCVQAEREGDDMTHHGLDGEEDGVGDYAPSDPIVDADDEDGETDISERAYDAAGIPPLPPSIWEATTRAALKRALEPHAPPLPSRATAADTMLNRFKSRHGLSGSVMHDLDEILTFLTENPDETFTPARQRRKDLTEQLQLEAPDVTYEVGVSLLITVLSAVLITVYSLRVALDDASGQYIGSK